jgi:putative colanic acid biosynthesis acetyltransferase WcaF
MPRESFERYEVFSRQNLSEFRVPIGFRGRPAWVVQIWWMVEATAFRWSPQVLYGWRRWLLRCFGARVGKGVLIRPTTSITYPWKLSLGDHSWIGDDVVLYTLAGIEVGANAVVSQRSYLCTGGHDHRKPTFDLFAQPIRIGAEAWLATDVFVAPGVEIGEGTVVGARSSVFASLPPGVIAMGSPARVVGPRETPTAG